MHNARGFGAIFVIFMMVFVDPILSYVRRRWYADTPKYLPPRKAFIRLAFAIPGLTLLVSLAVYLTRVDDLRRAAMLVVLNFLFGCMSGRYFYNRAQDRAADLGGEIVEPDDPEFANDLHDIAGLIAALVIMAAPVYVTW